MYENIFKSALMVFMFLSCRVINTGAILDLCQCMCLEHVFVIIVYCASPVAVLVLVSVLPSLFSRCPEFPVQSVSSRHERYAYSVESSLAVICMNVPQTIHYTSNEVSAFGDFHASDTIHLHTAPSIQHLHTFPQLGHAYFSQIPQ